MPSLLTVVLSTAAARCLVCLFAALTALGGPCRSATLSSSSRSRASAATHCCAGDPAEDALAQREPHLPAQGGGRQAEGGFQVCGEGHTRPARQPQPPVPPSGHSALARTGQSSHPTRVFAGVRVTYADTKRQRVSLSKIYSFQVWEQVWVSLSKNIIISGWEQFWDNGGYQKRYDNNCHENRLRSRKPF